MALAGRRLGRLDAADQQFELSDLVFECNLASLGEGDPGAGALSGVALLYSAAVNGTLNLLIHPPQV
jgi:hypothetical protein